MRITINLSTTPYLDAEPLIRKLRIVVMSLGILTVGAATLLGFSHFRKNAFQAEEHRLESAITRESDELGTYRKMLEKPENVSIAERALALNGLFDEKSFSWTILMKELEGIVPQEVQLATIQPIRERDGSINIRMHVVGPREKIIDLIHGLELSKNFSLPRVTGEATHSDARPNQHATALTVSSVEEFDIESGYDESASSFTPPGSAAAADRETSSAGSAGSGPPDQLTATAAPAATARSGGTRR
jgi:type IV pilus assembly protein PilN